MIKKKLEEINEEDIKQLITNEELESRTIEYKSELPTNTYASKKKFLASIISFINTIGGDLIFGIQEDRSTGKPISHEGISSSNIDQEILRLEQIIRNGIEPIVPSSVYRTNYIEQQSGNYIFIIRLGRSWLRPHRISLNSKSKFYARATNGKYPMDILEIRSSILLSETLTNQIKTFKEERITKISFNESFLVLKTVPKIVIHIIPVVSFELGHYMDPSSIRFQRWMPIFSSSANFRYNIDGLLYYDRLSSEQEYYTYVQIFKSGIIEAVDAYLLDLENNQKIFSSPAVENQIFLAIRNYLENLKSLEVDFPYIVFISFIGVEGYRIPLLGRRTSDLIDREILYLPEIMIETEDYNLSKLIRPTFNSLYNAFGLERHSHFNEEGEWSPRI